MFGPCRSTALSFQKKKKKKKDSKCVWEFQNNNMRWFMLMQCAMDWDTGVVLADFVA